MNWFKESWLNAKTQPLLAGAVTLFTLTVLLSATSATLSFLTNLALQEEIEHRTQLVCNISLANGRSIIEVAGATEDEPVPPEVIDLYEQIQLRNINNEIHKFDSDFQCTLPD